MGKAARALALASFGFVAFSAVAEETRCTAKVANRVYEVVLDSTARTLTVTTDNGFRYEGTVNYSYSPRANTDLYYLPLNIQGGIELELEKSGKNRIALCLNTNECYLCRR